MPGVNFSFKVFLTSTETSTGLYPTVPTLIVRGGIPVVVEPLEPDVLVLVLEPELPELVPEPLKLVPPPEEVPGNSISGVWPGWVEEWPALLEVQEVEPIARRANRRPMLPLKRELRVMVSRIATRGPGRGLKPRHDPA